MRRLGVIVLFAALLAPSAASAGIVPSTGSVWVIYDRYNGWQAEYNAGYPSGGERLTVTDQGDTLTIANANGIVLTDSPNCTSALTSVTCTAPGGFDEFTAWLGDGNDDLTVVGDLYTTINGQAGRDVLVGGDGTDWMFGGPGPDVVRGGAGDDWVSGLGDEPTDGIDQVDGGAGNDRVDGIDGQRETITCGDGTDIARVDPIDVLIGCETVRYTW